MTDLEWTMFGDACVSHDADAARELLLAVALRDASASHQTTEIVGKLYSELQYVVTYEGREWGYFSPSDLVDMNLTPQSKNVRLHQGRD